MEGKLAFDLYTDDDKCSQMLAELRENGSVKNLEIDMKRRDGKSIPFEVSISVIRDKDRAILGSVCVARNLSEAKKTLAALETLNFKLQEEMANREIALDALEKSRSEYRTIFENTGNATIIIEEDTTVSLANAEFARMAGYTKEEIEGRKSWIEFFTDEDVALMKEYHRLRRIDPNAAPRNYEARFKDSHAQLKYMYLTIATIPGTGKSVASFLDITQRKLAEQELKRSHQEIEQRSREIGLLNEMLNLLHVCNTGEETYYVLGNYIQKLFPSDSGFLYLYKDSKTTYEVVFSWGDLETSRQILEVDDCWALRQGKVHVVEEPGGVQCRHLSSTPATGYLCVPMTAQGEIIGLFHLRCSPPEANDHPDACRKIIQLKHRLAVAITDHIALALANLNMRERLRIQSIRDSLTGLFNRRFMEESLARELSRAKRHRGPLAVIMLDLDNFKHFNDVHGHEAGDVMLAEVGSFLKRSVRDEDIVCRYGGEEFIIIMPGAADKDAERRAEQIRCDVMKMKIPYGGDELGPVTVSIGVASLNTNGQTASMLVNAADKALYVAKSHGRNKVVVAEPLAPLKINSPFQF
jgi:diguanylate cyclase (GGDEF)-like protein/PAS domain S-box-containing protein